MTKARQTRPVSLWMAGIYGLLAFAVLALALALPLLFRAFLFHPFHVPSGSMIPTLLVGDYLLVSKFAYAPTFGIEPARGDVIAFLTPKDNATIYLKRIVGLPGDRIQMKEGQLHINDVAVARQRIEDFAGDDPCGGSPAKTKRWRETLPNGVSYETLDCVDNGFYDNTIVYAVPAGRLFVLGDNRDNSVDSRVLREIGYVPRDNVIGRAAMIFFSYGAAIRGTEDGIRFERIGTLVK